VKESLLDKYGKQRHPNMDDIDQLLLDLASIGSITFRASKWHELRLYVNSWVAKLDKENTQC
jgi:hypothetical protein